MWSRGGERGEGGQDSREEQTRVTRQTMRSKKRGGGRHPGISFFPFPYVRFWESEILFFLSPLSARGGEGQRVRLRVERGRRWKVKTENNLFSLDWGWLRLRRRRQLGRHRDIRQLFLLILKQLLPCLLSPTYMFLTTNKQGIVFLVW